MPITQEEELKYRLQGSLLEFTKYFYALRTGKGFIISEPVGRESHHRIISQNLTKVLRGDVARLQINIPPRYGKTELLVHFVAWALANYPDSNHLFISVTHELAATATFLIKEIMQMSVYKRLFGVELRQDSQAKDLFITKQGGRTVALGAGGTVTGQGAGIQGVNRYGGALIMDDLLKMEDALSETRRESTNEWFYNTAISRTNDRKTPIILNGQRAHEHDIFAFVCEKEPDSWEKVIIPALDEGGNSLYDVKHTRRDLLDLKEKDPYMFSAQLQQRPDPEGGMIFNPDKFVLLDENPNIFASFITADTAESDKNYSDFSVFSFWGVYKLEFKGANIPDMYGLHWIDCRELRIEPADLESEFIDFYTACMRFYVKPSKIAIEKKSTGVTLVSTLKRTQGLNVVDIERSKASGNKGARFLKCQYYVNSGMVSFPRWGKHTNHCIEHLRKLTPNDSHRYDDIGDTFADAVQIALIDKAIPIVSHSDYKEVGNALNNAVDTMNNLRNRMYGRK